MKIKYIALTLAAILSFGTFAVGCSSSENSEQQILDSREVDFSEIGLKYTTPESWQEYTKKNNIYPFTYTEDFTIENIRYNYITPTDWKTISNAKDGFVIDDYLYPICEIVVVQTENASKLKTSGLYTTFSSRELIKENNGVSYYLFSDYVGSVRKMSDEDVEIYDNICSVIDELAQSVNVTDFDVDAYVESKYAEKNTISFSSETLDGEAIDSSIFGDYDLTLFYSPQHKPQRETISFSAAHRPVADHSTQVLIWTAGTPPGKRGKLFSGKAARLIHDPPAPPHPSQACAPKATAPPEARPRRLCRPSPPAWKARAGGQKI